MSENNALWHPFTQHFGLKTLPKVISGKGALLTLEDGRELIDGISSWWVTIHGHAEKKIAEAIYEQALQLEQVIFAGFTHEPALVLSELLIAELNSSLKKVFFSDNGSTSVETALKMAYQYHKNRGDLKRTHLIAFDGAYHGDTVGAMSLGARSIFTEPFNDILFKVDRVFFPQTFIGDTQIEEKEARSLQELERLLDETTAALIMEPLIQGAAGMRMCRVSFLQKVVNLAKSRGALLIFDEVMTGFGRTGSIFAHQKAHVVPDILCLSKGLTGGFLPLAVTITSDEIFNEFLSEDKRKTFFHGHSYTANPLGCSAAIASFNLLKSKRQFEGFEERHLKHIEQWINSPHFSQCRVMGTIAAADVKTKEEGGYLNPISQKLQERLLDRGVLLRPKGNSIYILPPYCITDSQLDQIYSSVLASLV